MTEYITIRLPLADWNQIVDDIENMAGGDAEILAHVTETGNIQAALDRATDNYNELARQLAAERQQVEAITTGHLTTCEPAETEITGTMVAAAVDTFLRTAHLATTISGIDRAMETALHAALDAGWQQ